jgi:tetratricopeptide (TPR) repeat protein
MDLTRRVLLLAGVLAASMVLGCAASGQQRPAQQAAPAAKPAPPAAPFVRAEHLCATLGEGKATASEVKKDLAAILTRPDGGMAADDSMSEFFGGCPGVSGATEEKLSICFSTLAYKDLLDKRIDLLPQGKNPKFPHAVQIRNGITLNFKNNALAQCVAEELRFIQKDLRQAFLDRGLAAHQTYVAEYKAANPKPAVTEEQRMYIVQANAMAEKKEFAKSIELYINALKINGISYPAAYYNMGLILSQMEKYMAAIVSMKVYLLMLPDAPDARSAQDKIYEWQAAAGMQ